MKRMKGVKYLLMVLVLFFAAQSQASAAIINTQPVNANCGGKCDGYYTNHFAANFQVTSVSGANYFVANRFRLTMTSGNQFGDTWGLMTLNVNSLGSRVASDISQANNIRTNANSSYWVTLNRNINIAKGNNRVEFRIAYILRNKNGSVAERWYPVRATNNVS